MQPSPFKGIARHSVGSRAPARITGERQPQPCLFQPNGCLAEQSAPSSPSLISTSQQLIHPLMRHAMHRHDSKRLADSSWLLQRRDLAPEESAYWLIEWSAMQLLQRRQVAKRTLPPTR